MGDILIITYLFEPDMAVGAFRPSYWAHRFAALGYKVTIVTQTPRADGGTEVYERIVIPTGIGWGLLKDPGLSWKKGLKHYLKNLRRHAFKSIIITGGPFLQMTLSRFIKNHFETNLILDFRDPFAINPRFEESWLKVLLKKALERYMCHYADHVVTVNRFTADLLQTPSSKITIIENGYNETVLDKFKTTAVPSESNHPIRLIHTGKVSPDRDPTHVLQAVREMDDVHFIHYGNELEGVQPSPSVILNGFVSYEEVLKAITQADICLVLTNGEPFISTTKIFDYIGLNKKVLIVTNGEPHTGNLEEITRTYPNVGWAKNNAVDIRNVLNDLAARPVVTVDTSVYSRSAYFSKLVNLVEEVA